MSDRRQAVGRRGEQIAADRLQERGWRVVETNWRSGRGEIDIVARDGEWLVVVEVRTRSTGGFGRPEDSIGRRKRERLLALGAQYVQTTGWPGPWRIDVVAVQIDRAGESVRLRHYPNAIRPG